MSAPENPPAFPRDHRHLGHNGMTLRDYFAGQALSTMAVLELQGWSPREVADEAYRYADAMLAAREAGAA